MIISQWTIVIQSESQANNKMFELHKSGIQDFAFCPFKFYLRNILHMKEAESVDIALEKGTVMHQAFQDFFDFIDLDEISKLEFEKAVRAYFRRMLANYYKEYPLLKTAWDNFTAFEAARFWKLLQKGQLEDFYMPYFTEMEFKNQVSKDLTLAGTIDRVDAVEDGLVIIEYKSSSTINMTSLRRELYFYYAAAHHKIEDQLGTKVKYIGIIAPMAVRLVNGTKFKQPEHGIFIMEPLQKRSMKALERWIDTLFKAMKTNDFPKNETMCPFCSFREVCSYVKPP